MRLLYIITLLSLGFSLFGQSTLYDNGSGFTFQGISGTDPLYEFDTGVIDISDCASIQISYDFAWSEDWPGSGNMESNDECNFGNPCAGDPTDPFAGDCANCWDMLYTQIFVDGNEETNDLQGFAGWDQQSGMYTYGPFCTNGAEELEIEFDGTVHATDESVDVTNIVVLCWDIAPEITTNDPICGGQDLILDGDASDASLVSAWEWTTNGPGNIDDATAQNTTASDVEDGDEFTLTTTDMNGCTASETVAIVAGGYEVSLSGGGEICEGSCTDIGSDIVIEIMGGDPLYDITLQVNGITIPGLPAIDVDETFRICADPDAALPSYDDSEDPAMVIIPTVFFPIDIELISIVDETGCTGTITNGDVSFELFPSPDINFPNVPTFCLGSDGIVDLTVMDLEILDGQNFDVRWFEDDELTDEILNPSQYNINNGNVVYAVVDDGDCFSEAIEIGLNFDQQPELELLITEIVDCGDNLYELPPLNEVANFISFINPAFYLDEDHTIGPIQFIDPSVTEVFIYDASVPGCDTTVMIEVNISPNPIITNPSSQLGGCGSVELPTPEGDFIDGFIYNTEEDGSGTDFDAGDTISSTDGITTLYLIASAANGCETILEIELTLTNAINYTVVLPDPICDSLVLPQITPNTGAVAYYTESMGNGMSLLPGDVLYAPFVGDLFIFDPSVDPTCATEEIINININTGSQPIHPQDTTVCEFLVLPDLGPNTGLNIRYAMFPFTDPANSFFAGDTIDFSQRLYILDTIGACIYFDSLDVNIALPPNVGHDTSIVVCQGFFSDNFDFMSLIGNPDLSGQWNYPMIPDFEPNDSTRIDLSVIPVGNYSFSYTIEDPLCGTFFSQIDIEVIEGPYGGEDENLLVCAGANTVDFMSLINNPDTGGAWEQVSGPETVSFSDSTMVDLSGNIEGNYVFLYVIEGDSNINFCDPVSSSLFIEVAQAPNAGEDTEINVCAGDIIELTEQISTSADITGFFEADGIFFTGTTWNTGATMSGEVYTIDYIVLSGSMSCPSDTAQITVNIVEQLSAGQATANLNACEDQLINLNDYLDNASPGGIFVLTSDLTTEVIGGEWFADQSTSFSYIVEGTGTCMSDTTEILLNVIQTPSIDITLDNSMICAIEGNTIELLLSNNTSSTINYSIEILDGIGDPIGSIEYNDTASVILNLATSGVQGLIRNDTIYLGENPGFFFYEVNADNDGCSIPEIIGGQIIITPAIEETINTTLCPGDSLEFNGQFYTQSEVVAIPGVVEGCDSIFNLEIDYYPQEVANVTQSLCAGEVFTILGQSYSSDTNYIETFVGASIFGCDSIVELDLSFQNSTLELIEETLCEGESIVIEGITFDQINNSGEITLINGSQAGCDSLIRINLDFAPASTFNLNDQICTGESILIGTDTYDENNLSGTTILVGEDQNGCDSIVNVDLDIIQSTFMDLNPILCPGIELTVNGNVYNESNPSGTEMLLNAAGCDSTISVNLTYLAEAVGEISNEICAGQSITVGPDTYDENNLSGTTILPNASIQGCDSIVNVSLILSSASSFDLQMEICPGETVEVGPDTYDENNLSGTTILPNASIQGCDSIVNVNLILSNASSFDLLMDICPGESLQVGTDIYDENNLIGSTLLSGQATQGCDSIVNVTLNLLSNATSEFSQDICHGEEFIIGSDTYNQSNLVGTSTLVGAATNGCDSIINVELNLLSAFANITADNACPEDTETILTINQVDNLVFPITVMINGMALDVINTVPYQTSIPVGDTEVMLVGSNGCSFQENLMITNLSDVNISIDSDLIGENTYQLNVNTDFPALSFSWLNNEALSCLSCPNPIAAVIQNTIVEVTVESEFGCLFTESINLDFNAPLPDSEFYIPNIIDVINPPNNNFFIQSNNSGAVINAMRIFDRWGNLVFERENFSPDDPSLGWDGTMNNQFVEQGVYVYSVSITNSEGRIELFQGDITVIR